MDKAKSAVSDFMKKAGHHDTTVHEKVAPAVVKETVSPTRHEHVQSAVDKEVHQDHYHTSVQPVKDQQVLPEKHSHTLAGVEERRFEHGDSKDVETRLATEAGQFRDERVVGSTTHTHSTEPTIAGEHVHHHVHETIQPVVQKQTIQPEVIHTTVPIHEVHHNAAQHHASSALPAVSMQDFKKQGGVLTGREERHDGFEGEPRSVGGALGGSSTGTTATGTTGTGMTDGMNGTSRGVGPTSGIQGPRSERDGLTGTTGTSNLDTLGSDGTTTTKKATLGEKLNPKIDADGDGKKGIMS